MKHGTKYYTIYINISMIPFLKLKLTFLGNVKYSSLPIKHDIMFINLLKVMCPCKYSCVYTLSKYADKTLTKKRPVARCDW